MSNFIKGALQLTAMISLLAGFMFLNALHWVGAW